MTTPPIQGMPYGAPSPYATGPWQQPPPSRGLAIASLVLALLFFVPLALIVSVVLAIIVLARGKDGRDHGRGMAIAALVIDGVILLGTVAIVVLVYAVGGAALEAADTSKTSEVTAAGDVNARDIRDGDCVNDNALSQLKEGEQYPVTQRVGVVPCSRAHVFEVFHDFELPDGDFPGQKAVTTAADRGCLGAFEDFVGVRPAKSELEVFYYFPQRRSWQLLDDRAVTCLVTAPEGQVRGSLEDSRR